MHVYFNDWVEWLYCVEKFVPEAIHNPVSIKVLLTKYMLCTPVFTS